METGTALGQNYFAKCADIKLRLLSLLNANYQVRMQMIHPFQIDDNWLTNGYLKKPKAIFVGKFSK